MLKTLLFLLLAIYPFAATPNNAETADIRQAAIRVASRFQLYIETISDAVNPKNKSDNFDHSPFIKDALSLFLNPDDDSIEYSCNYRPYTKHKEKRDTYDVRVATPRAYFSTLITDTFPKKYDEEFSIRPKVMPNIEKIDPLYGDEKNGYVVLCKIIQVFTGKNKDEKLKYVDETEKTMEIIFERMANGVFKPHIRSVKVVTVKIYQVRP